MDGVRAYWDGEKLLSRNLKPILSCPQWFYEKLPKDMKLDGEFWMGRKKLEMTLATINSKEENELWKQIKFMIFDLLIPNQPYEKRMEQLKSNIQIFPSFVRIIDTKICQGNDDLMEELNIIVSNGGEGIVVTKPQSLYLAERTRVRLKVKVNYYFFLIFF